MSFRDRLKALTRWQRVSLGVALAVAVYAAFGFLAVPPLLRGQVIEVFHETFGREARMGEVRLNPFLLTLDVDRFELPDRDGSPFVRFESLHVDFELSSVWHRAFTFADIRLVSPFVHVKVLADGSLNFGDMIETLLAEDVDAEPQAGADAPPPLLVHLARIEQGRIVFSDLSRPTHFEHEISPLDVELRDFGTRPDDNSPYSFTATTGAGEALEWEGSVSVVPLHSKGRFALTGVRPRTGWLYVQDDVLFEVVEGSVDVEGDYDVDAREGLQVRLEQGEIRVRDLRVVDRASGDDALMVGELDVKGIRAAYPEQTLQIDSITTMRGRHHALRLEDGSFRIEQLFSGEAATSSQPAEAEAEADAEAEPERSEPEPNASPPAWSVEVGRVALEDHHIDFEDRSTSPPVEMSIGPIELTLDGVSSDLTRPIPTELEVRLPEGGRVHVQGPLRASAPLAQLDIEIEDFDLRPFEPYWLPVLDVDLTSGRLAVAGRLEASVEEGAEPEVRFAGDVRLNALRAVDRSLRTSLLSWSALELLGLDVSTAPTKVSLERLVLREPKALVVLAADGTSNLSRVVVADPSAAEEAAPPVESAVVPVRIGAVEIASGAAEFEDRTIDPVFRTGISQLDGRIEGLSSDPGARATVDLSGRIAGATPMKIQGVASPLAEQTYVDLDVGFENFELSSLTPYSGRHIGQTIARGKLFVDVEYVLDGPKITGENRIFLDQFTLGEKVDSPDALNLPIGLAIALIKDRNGEIHIDLPVRGNVDDPEFSVAGLIFSALGNLITKVALSPFAMLGGLAGGGDGESMKTVSFAPGSATLDASEQTKLDALARALAERPALALEVSGSARERVDGPALQAATLEQELRQARFVELQAKWFGEKPEDVDAVVLAPKDRARLLQARYERVFGARPRSMLVPALEVDPESPLAQATPEEQQAAWSAELERRVRAEIPIPASDLRQLAQLRSQAVRDYVVGSGGVESERVFLLEGVLDTGSDDVPMAELSLTAH